MRRELVVQPVPRQERDPPSTDVAERDRRRCGSVRGIEVDLLHVLEEPVEARSAEHPDLGRRRHDGSFFGADPAFAAGFDDDSPDEELDDDSPDEELDDDSPDEVAASFFGAGSFFAPPSSFCAPPSSLLAFLPWSVA